MVGSRVGRLVETIGPAVGAFDGLQDGSAVLGCSVDSIEGGAEGWWIAVGCKVGCLLGVAVGEGGAVGNAVGLAVGDALGLTVGAEVGPTVGC